MRYVENPPNPWLSTSVEWIGEPPEAKLEVFEETATRSIITHNESPDVGFEYSINCYRGCTHACSYCFSRPTHEYLGFGAGTDFETKIVAKVRAPERLREEFMRPSWRGQTVVFSFTSDPYIPLEFNYKLTRRCLEVCLEFRNPVGVVTKSALVRRDKELLAARFRAMAELAEAGVPVGLAIAPVIPGLSDSHIPELLKRAKEAGARTAFINLLRLPGSVAPYFEQRLRERLPTKADRVLARQREVRGGRLNVARFGERMRGRGVYWKLVEQSFRVHCARLGFNQDNEHAYESRPNTFR